jgi:AraC-like DNA-binding protein
MTYYILQPSERLADYVQCFWIFEGGASAELPFALRTPASGFPELLFHYKGTFDEQVSHNQCESSFTSGIHGQTSRYRQFTVSENFGMIGVRLYPYALKTLFDTPAVEFTNQLPDLFSFLKPTDISIHQRVFEAGTNPERVLIISNFLEARIKECTRPEIVYAVQHILKHNGSIGIKHLASECTTSQRQFERNFKELTGFTAKTFSRIIRFNALLKTHHHKAQSLTEVALDHGYYDQSHFIHDFKEFLGVNPHAYFSKKLGLQF